MITKRISTWAFALTLASVGYGQIEWHANPGGNTIVGGEWFGADVNSTIPLQIRHDANQPIEWYTDAIQRMGLNPTQNSTINGFTVPTDGFLGLGLLPVPGTAPGTPWSRLHLHDATSGAGFVALGFRDWMRNGVTFTGHGDQMFVGHKYGPGPTDGTDAIFQWADNSSELLGPDLMRFIFTSDFTNAIYGENSLFGREIMQLHPRGFVGIGDWNEASVVAGSTVAPTDRLDVLTGNVRIRELPGTPQSTSAEMVVVRPDGVLEHRPMPTGGAADCKWTLLGAAGSNSSIATAYATNPGCPQADRAVGIGTNSPSYKLDVRHSAADAGLTGGLKVNYLGNAAGFTYGINTVVEPLAGTSMGTVTGIRAAVTGVETGGAGVTGEITAEPLGESTTQIIGVSGKAIGPTSATLLRAYGTKGEVASREDGDIVNAWGLHGFVGGDGSITNSYGVYAWAPSGTNRYSVYGRTPNTTTGGWAGFFTGDISVNGITVPCDESLKTNIQELTNGSELLMQLHPKSYEYRHDEYPQMGLPNGVRYGFLSPDVQAVLPQLTKPVHQPEELDSLGNEIYPAVDYLGMSPLDIIPIVVAAVQDDHQQLADAQATIAALNDQLQQVTDRLDAMEQNVASCCAMHSDQRSISGEELIDEKSLNAKDRLLRITPNPFGSETTIYYQIESSGRMQLMANSADGKQLRVLHEANLEQGNYQFEWSTADLVPGIYYVTLLLDGKPLTKKAVKMM